MKTAIVSGANGFVGNAVVKELLQNGYKVMGLHHGDQNKVAQNNNLEWLPFDLSNAKALLDLIQPAQYDAFYHFAWAGSAGSARADTALQLNNVQWTVDALRVAKQLGCRRFVGAGSIMEHESVACLYTQGSKPGDVYTYGCAKTLAHMMCRTEAVRRDMEFVWPILTNAYGPNDFGTRFINQTIRQCLQGKKPKFSEGKQNYDFVYIDDVARAFRLIGENGKSFYSYLIGSGQAGTLKRFLQKLQSEVAPETEFCFGAIPYTGTSLSLDYFDCSNTEKDTGFRAEVDFQEGCRRTVLWWKDYLGGV
jgi:nucleoside-diphosphate-sugar epimerase